MRQCVIKTNETKRKNSKTQVVTLSQPIPRHLSNQAFQHTLHHLLMTSDHLMTNHSNGKPTIIKVKILQQYKTTI